MKQSHPNCTDERCKICLSDHLEVGKKLEELTGNNKQDHLGRFHSWLKLKGISPETEHGWGTSSFFDDELMKEYSEEYKKY